MMSPAFDSEMPKSSAMSVRRPMGMNSDMLKMNTLTAMPISGSHCLPLTYLTRTGFFSPIEITIARTAMLGRILIEWILP